MAKEEINAKEFLSYEIKVKSEKAYQERLYPCPGKNQRNQAKINLKF